MKVFPKIITLVALVGVAGCGKKPEEAADTRTTPASTPTAATAPTTAPATPVDPIPPSIPPSPPAGGPAEPTAKLAVQEAQKVASVALKEVAPELKTQAAEAFANLGQQLVASTLDGNSDSVLKSIGADLETRVGKLAQSLAGNEAVKDQLSTSVKALLGNQDVDAVAALNTLAAARLTPEQTALAKEVYQTGAAFVTQRNFASLPGVGSEVGQLVNAVWKGNYTQALVPLQKVYGKASLTPAQKNLLATTFDPYLPKGWKEAAGALQQGVEQFKKLKF